MLKFQILVMLLILNVAIVIGQPVPEIINVTELPKMIRIGEEIFFDITARNAGSDAKNGSITLSFPELTAESDISRIRIYSSTTNTDFIKFYPKGNNQLHNKDGNTFTSQMLTVEYGKTDWQQNEEHRFVIAIDASGNDSLRFRYRVNMGTSDQNYINQPLTSEVADQQGWPVFESTIKIRDFGGDASTIWWQPSNPDKNSIVNINVENTNSGKLHWGVNGWETPDNAYWPENSNVFESNTAVQSMLVMNNDGSQSISVGPFNSNQIVNEINFVISYNDGTWDNNNSSDYKINISQSVNLNETNDEIVSDFSLKQNYPNPFNPSTKIEYSIKESSNVSIVVYHLLGQKVATLVNKKMSPGNYTVDFDASNLSSGVYLYKIEAGNFVQTKKMVLIK